MHLKKTMSQPCQPTGDREGNSPGLLGALNVMQQNIVVEDVRTEPPRMLVWELLLLGRLLINQSCESAQWICMGGRYHK